MPSKPKTLHVISNTHHDREHRHAFQETRIMLVQMMDELIRIMENDPGYKYFTLDGQAIVLDDYLEVKPGMSDRLKKLIRDGRILIGPWYSLTDCNAVMPESIIRNLLVGHRSCRKFGEPMKLGYSIFSFGQIAQLPQVYSGFGINDIVLYKGASGKALPQSEFIWAAPDGTETFATRLGKEARWNFYFDFDIPVILGGNVKKPGWESKFTDDIGLCHMNDEAYKTRYATELAPDIRVREDKIEESVNAVLELLDESASENIFLAFDGTDFTSPLKEIPAALDAANRIMDGKVRLVHSTPVTYFNEVKADITPGSLVRYEGEIRFGPVSKVHSETMGTNSEIKQAMFRAENTILHYAEPLSTFLKANGGSFEKEILDLAWKYLFAAQAHDSIHGSGDPKIKPDTLNRLAQVQEIADSITRRAVEGLAGLIDMSGFEQGDILLAVFNTTWYGRDEIMNFTVDLPAGERAEECWLEELDGTRVETYQLARHPFNLPMIHKAYRPKSVYSDRIELQARIKDIPPMGFKLLKIRRTKGCDATYAKPFPIGHFPYNPIGKSVGVMDNGLLKVTVESDGIINVYDYETKKTYNGLNCFTDTGCSGDFWIHRTPFYDQTITSRGTPAKIECIRNSGLSATCRVSIAMDIPESLTGNKMSRIRHVIPTAIVSEITVNKGSKRLDFKTSLDNKCNDHMFTVSFPTGINADVADWEAPFEIRQRAVDQFTDNNGEKGPELERQAMQGFVDVSDGEDGFALFSKGLREAGTVNYGGAVINLTLFRAVSSVFPIHDDLFIGFEEEPSQCIGRQSFEYAIYFHKGDFAQGRVIAESRKYTVPPVSAQLGYKAGGTLKGSVSFMRSGANTLILNAVKPAEDGEGVVVRITNPTSLTVHDEIYFMNEIVSACLTNMEEDERQMLTPEKHSLKVAIAPYKICTYYITF